MINAIIINENDVSSQWYMKWFESINSAKDYVINSCCNYEEYKVISDNDCHFRVTYKQKGFNIYATTTVYYNKCFWK